MISVNRLIDQFQLYMKLHHLVNCYIVLVLSSDFAMFSFNNSSFAAVSRQFKT